MNLKCEYCQELFDYHNDNLGNYSSMISQINDLKPDIVHLFYDNRIDIAS